jgi:CNT family concentrative nucleoside transporter
MGAELKYLLAAAFMAAPGGLLMAKILMPDDEVVRSGEHEKLTMERSQHGNVILAAASGTSDGLRLAVNIGAMLVAFVALIALFNGLVGGLLGLVGIDASVLIELLREHALGRELAEAVLIPGSDRVAFEAGLIIDEATFVRLEELGVSQMLVTTPVTMQFILGMVFKPLMYLLSVPWDEAQAAGALFGEKIILNEFVAFSHLNDYLEGMSPRTIAVTTFSLCGFANLSSIAILLGGLGVLVPEKKELIGRFGMKCVLAASLSNLMSAALAGLMLTF